MLASREDVFNVERAPLSTQSVRAFDPAEDPSGDQGRGKKADSTRQVGQSGGIGRIRRGDRSMHKQATAVLPDRDKVMAVGVADRPGGGQ